MHTLQQEILDFAFLSGLLDIVLASVNLFLTAGEFECGSARYIQSVLLSCRHGLTISVQYLSPVSVQIFPLYRLVENDFYCV